MLFTILAFILGFNFMPSEKNHNNTGRSVEIFTDGACSGNPGPGGYGAVLIYKDTIKEISGYHPETTNNRMEMTAAIEALKLMKRPCNVIISTDSSYLCKGITEWLPGWLKKNWLNSRKEPVLNKDLWVELYELDKIHNIQWKWIKGHADNKYNERCDHLAREAIKTKNALI